MNNRTIAILAVVTLSLAALVGVAAAGINPASYGLPPVTFTSGAATDNLFYNVAVTVPGKQASAMCVKCHTRNPSHRTQYRATAGIDYVGSHFVTRTFTDTNPGGGYPDSDKGVRSAPIYMADNTAGALGANFVGVPKYGALVGGVPDNTINRAIGTYPGTSAQIICESCHNIIRNIGPAKLIAQGFANGAATSGAGINTKGTTDPHLCIGCHGRMDSGVNAEWKLHPDAAGSTWVGTQHHRNTSATSVYAGSGTPLNPADMGTMAAAYYTPVQQMWAVGPGSLTGSRALNYTSAPPPLGRISPMNDNNQIMPSTGRLVCTNCHRAHNADSSAGATILMRGSMAPIASNRIGTGTLPTDNNTTYWGVRRMSDKGGRSAAFDTTNPHCLACHQ